MRNSLESLRSDVAAAKLHAHSRAALDDLTISSHRAAHAQDQLAAFQRQRQGQVKNIHSLKWIRST